MSSLQRLFPHPSPARILSICDETPLSLSRQLLLQSAGYEVYSTRSSCEIALGKTGDFALALLCHTVESRKAAEIAGALRAQHPGLPVMQMIQAGNVADPGAERIILTELHPAALLAKVAEVLQACELAQPRQAVNCRSLEHEPLGTRLLESQVNVSYRVHDARTGEWHVVERKPRD